MLRVFRLEPSNFGSWAGVPNDLPHIPWIQIHLLPSWPSCHPLHPFARRAWPIWTSHHTPQRKNLLEVNLHGVPPGDFFTAWLADIVLGGGFIPWSPWMKRVSINHPASSEIQCTVHSSSQTNSPSHNSRVFSPKPMILKMISIVVFHVHVFRDTSWYISQFRQFPNLTLQIDIPSSTSPDVLSNHLHITTGTKGFAARSGHDQTTNLPHPNSSESPNVPWICWKTGDMFDRYKVTLFQVSKIPQVSATVVSLFPLFHRRGLVIWPSNVGGCKRNGGRLAKKPETLIQWLLQGTSYMKAGNGTWISQLFICVS